jgi:hypothetical protein
MRPAIFVAGVAGRSGSAHSHLLPTEQAVGPCDQHRGHHEKFGHQRQFGEIHREAAKIHDAEADAQRLHLGDDDRRKIGAGDRAHAADHNDDEGVADHDQVGRQRRRLARNLQRAAKASEQSAEREHAREQHGLVDAERAHHLTVLRGCAHQPTEAGLGQRQMQHPQYEGADENQEDIVSGQPAAEHLDGAGQAWRARAKQILRTPDPQRRVVDNEHQRESSEQLKQLRRAINPPQQKDLDRSADQGHQQCGQNNAAPEADGTADLGGDAVGDIGPDHIEGPVSDIDDPGDAENQRQPGRHEEQAGGGRQAV